MHVPFPPTHRRPVLHPRPVPLLPTLLVLTLGLPHPLPVSLPLSPSTVVPAAAPALAALATLPLAFVPNVGQTDPAVRFQAHSGGGTVFFTDRAVVLSLPAPRSSSSRPAPLPAPVAAAQAAADSSSAAPTTVRLQFQGANTTPRVIGSQQLPGVVNDLRGNDPAHWRTNVPTYAGIVYQELYPGINLHYTGGQDHLKGTYIVAPEADPTRIQWHYTGTDQVQLDAATGALRLLLPGRAADPLIDAAPIAWQEVRGQRVPVPVRYVLGKNGSIRFALGNYDPSQPLIIDPILEFSTYLGGSASDGVSDITMDGTGNVYVIGTTSSPDFPTHNPLQPHYRDVVCGDLGLHCADVFVAKLQPNGRTLLWSTYLGGSHRDAGGGITLDRASNVYLTGDTYSADFPLTNAWDSTFESYQDAFVAKLNASGTGLIYSTYLGGGSGEEGRSIAVDSSGNAYITGHTRSSDFPLKQAVQARFNEGRDLCDIPCPDAFVTKLTANGTDVVYSTFLGSGYLDFGVDIAVDRAGSAYVTGYTGADDFPTTSGAFQPASAGNDAFVTKFHANGQALMYSTYLGGSLGENLTSRGYELAVAGAIAVDPAGFAYVTGLTASVDFPVKNAIDATHGASCAGEGEERDCSGSDAFVTKLTVDGSDLVYSSFLGGRYRDEANGIAVDHGGNAYVTGVTASTDFPTVRAIQPTFGGGPEDAFVATLSAAGQALLTSTYLGGNASDIGTTVAGAGTHRVYVAGTTQSLDFPTSRAFQPAVGGGACGAPGEPMVTCADAFVAKLHLGWSHTIFAPLVTNARSPEK